MGNQNKNKNSSALNRLAQQNVQKNSEFGKMGNQSKKDPKILHEEKPPSNHMGIDRGRWSE
ncbi:MAG: hypothetical protein K6U80_18535 [Firmicutes bacterium]|nr:hypothetical protein [Bacillota bacterium]